MSSASGFFSPAQLTERQRNQLIARYQRGVDRIPYRPAPSQPASRLSWGRLVAITSHWLARGLPVVVSQGEKTQISTIPLPAAN